MLLARIEQGKAGDGDIVFMLPPRDQELADDASLRARVLTKLVSQKKRLHLATKLPVIVSEARSRGLKVVDRLPALRKLLKDHPQLDEAVRLFSPHYWRQELKTRLQRMGLLSLPTLRVYILGGVSLLLFLFVAFRLFPSAEIRVWPRQEPVTDTVNVFLSSTGALATLPPKVHTLPLASLKVHLHHALTFSDISKQFIGTSATVAMTIVNKSTETYGLRKGTRLMNQAGMVFLLDRAVVVEAGAESTVPATAADLDIYQQIIGDRGNVPAALRWEIPGLPVETRELVYGTNAAEAKGGTTAYRTVLQQQDLDTARKRLEQELLAAAKQQIEEERRIHNAQSATAELELLSYDELTKIHYSNFKLPTEFLGQPVTSIPVEGDIDFRMFAYDKNALLSLLRGQLLSHIRDDKRVLDETLSEEHLDVRVISYDDALAWIKLTVELTGTQEHILDPLTPNGALFAKHVREQVQGKGMDEALRILRNMPEVDRVEISLWPPWDDSLPTIPSNIRIIPSSQ